MTDGELIDQFVGGNLHAFNTLVWRWEKPIYNFILRYVDDAEEARDLCQTTFVKVYRNLHRLRDRERFRPWLYQIAVNLSRDALKKRRRSPVYSLDALRETSSDGKTEIATVPDTTHDPDRHVQQAEVVQWIRRALAQIPDEQRIVVIMKQFQGLKFTEIAEALDTPLNTVKSRMYYGLTALRKILEKWHIDQEAIGYDL